MLHFYTPQEPVRYSCSLLYVDSNDLVRYFHTLKTHETAMCYCGHVREEIVLRKFLTLMKDAYLSMYLQCDLCGLDMRSFPIVW